jgi:Sec-independent protein translocase protein TatA
MACANSDLARFAPPGLVKYEDIAGDQPINPVVAERVAERKQEPGAGKFPRLSETPGKAQRPAKRPVAEVESQMSELAAARDTVDKALAEDRAEAAAEATDEFSLPERRDALKTQVDEDAAAAARERRENLKPPQPEK